QAFHRRIPHMIGAKARAQPCGLPPPPPQLPLPPGGRPASAASLLDARHQHRRLLGEHCFSRRSINFFPATSFQGRGLPLRTEHTMLAKLFSMLGEAYWGDHCLGCTSTCPCVCLCVGRGVR
ncbi:MAG: hypothetical protein ACPIOQ_46935, partial [Promethearchaeia archaeon]